MKAGRKLKLAVYIFGFAGAALFTVLLVRQGILSVGSAMRLAGWGIAAVAVFHFIPLFLDAIAWWVLFPRSERPTWQSLCWMRWIGEAVTNLVPSAAVGGDIVRARLAAIHGVPIAVAAASVIVDITLGVFTQIGFTLLGLFLLVRATGQTSFVGPTLVGVLIGLTIAAAFYFVQRVGVFRFVGTMISRLVRSPEWQSVGQSGETLDQAVRALYGRRRGVLLCCALTVASLLASCGEIWIALHAIGIEATFLNAVILQSMAMTIRSAFFVVPGALGVQEGGYLVLGSLLRIPGDAAFAISLITRMRDLAVGIPALIAWQFIEGRRVLRRSVSVD